MGISYQILGSVPLIADAVLKVYNTDVRILFHIANVDLYMHRNYFECKFFFSPFFKEKQTITHTMEANISQTTSYEKKHTYINIHHNQ